MAATTPVDWSATKMRYNRLGNSGLKVSAMSFGSWTTFGSTVGDTTAYDTMTAALKGGVNFFDNAEAYASGKSETVMGEILQRWFSEGVCKRCDVVISTKIFWGDGANAGVQGGPNVTGLSRKHIIEGINASLARLKLDYVDLVFCHRPDPLTPIEETVRAMNHVINQGKAFYWGTSEWSAEELSTAHAIADRLNLVGPLMEQPQYNLFKRARVEVEYNPLYINRGLGTTIWSPLASGLLTGKYSGNKIPEGARLGLSQNDYFRKSVLSGANLDVKDNETILKRVDGLGVVAQKLGCTRAQLALAWCMANPRVSTVITGASRVEQVHENLAALDLHEKMTPEIMAEIEAIVQTKPAPIMQNQGRGDVRIC